MVFEPIYVIWTQPIRSGGYRILLKKSTDEGQTFSSKLTVYKSKNHTDSGPQFWQDKTNSVYVVWNDGKKQVKPAYNLLFKKSTNVGDTFGPTINVNSNDPQLPFLTNSFSPKIAVDSNDNIYIVSNVTPSHKPNSQKIVLHKSTDSGQTFELVTSVTNQGIHPSIAIDSQDIVYVSWKQNFQIILKKSTDGGQTFGIETIVSDNGSDTLVNTDFQDNVYVSWRTESQNDEVFLKKSTNGGKKFQNEINITNSPQDSYNYHMAIDSTGNLYVVWYEEGAAPAGEILFKKITDGGNIPGPIQITKLVKLSDSHVPKVGISSNVIYVMWNDGTLNNPNSNVLFFKRSTNGGNSFTQPIQIN